jgi:hypothetical protein
MPCCTQYPHPLRMNYIYYKPNEQYIHLLRLAHFVAMLEHLSNTFIIFIMKYLHNNLNKKCNLIFLYNYIAHFHERTPWSISWFVYISIVNFWSSFVYGWDSIKRFKLQYPHINQLMFMFMFLFHYPNLIFVINCFKVTFFLSFILFSWNIF